MRSAHSILFSILKLKRNLKKKIYFNDEKEEGSEIILEEILFFSRTVKKMYFTF
jgi:hypothetical protein